MTRAASTRRLRFLPYRFEELGLTLTPMRCLLDGGRDLGAGFDPDRHLIDLSSTRFNDVRIELAIELPAAVLGAVFPPEEQAAPPGALLILVHCAATRLRRHVALDTGPGLAAGLHLGTIDLAHGDLAGSVELTPMLVRAGEPRAGDPAFAAARGARLASGRPLEVRIETQRDPTGDFLDIRYASFREKGPPQFPRIAAVYQLECEGEHPILWLNSDHQRLCSVLDDLANVGRMARLRDLLYDRITYAVWVRLFLRTARDQSQLGEAVYPWQQAVLGKLLPLVYPEVADQESRISFLQRDLEGGNQDEIFARLDSGLQEELDLGHCATALTEELS